MGNCMELSEQTSHVRDVTKIDPLTKQSTGAIAVSTPCPRHAARYDMINAIHLEPQWPSLHTMSSLLHHQQTATVAIPIPMSHPVACDRYRTNDKRVTTSMKPTAHTECRSPIVTHGASMVVPPLDGGCRVSPPLVPIRPPSVLHVGVTLVKQSADYHEATSAGSCSSAHHPTVFVCEDQDNEMGDERKDEDDDRGFERSLVPYGVLYPFRPPDTFATLLNHVMATA